MNIKQLLVLVFAVLLANTAFGQWNNTADSQTTGSLTVGSDVNNSYSKIAILGPNVPGNEGSKRELMFNFKDAGTATIQAYRGGGWDTSLQFLTSLTGPASDKRMALNGNGTTEFYDRNISIGGFTSQTLGEGARLYFHGLDWDGDDLFISKYANGTNQTDLRVNIGDDGFGDDRFVVGNRYQGTAPWQSWLTVVNNGRVGIGTDNPYYKLDVNGTLRAKEIKVNLNSGADFVFDANYPLKSIAEVQDFIKENKHLPEIPSAVEMTSGDVNLGELQIKLLQKIEELTLYVIQQNDKIQTLENKVNELENK